jgi:hypothetical protein
METCDAAVEMRTTVVLYYTTDGRTMDGRIKRMIIALECRTTATHCCSITFTMLRIKPPVYHYTLIWGEDTQFRDFIDKSIPNVRKLKRADSKGEATITLDVDFNFFRKYNWIDDDETEELLASLAATPLNMVYFGLYRVYGHNAFSSARRRTHEKSIAHWNQLYKCLGSISTLNSARLTADFTPIYDPTMLFGQAIRSLLGIRAIKIHLNNFSEEAVQDLCAGLENHPSIQTVRIHTKADCFYAFFPMLKALPLLKNVILMNVPINGNSRYVESAQAREIANFLMTKASIDVTLECFKFSSQNEQSLSIILQGIAGALVDGMTIDNIEARDVDAVVFAKALTASKLTAIRLTKLDFSKANDNANLEGGAYMNAVSVFFRELALGISTMPQLEVLDCRRYSYYKEVEDNDATLAIARAAAQCPKLRVLKLPIVYFTASMDRALAKVVETHENLEEIEVYWSRDLLYSTFFHFPA